MPYQSGLIPNLWTSYRQRRATGGRPLTSAEMRGLLDPLKELEFQRGEASAERERQQSNINRQLSLQEQAYSDQSKAASVSGVTDLLGLGLNYKLGKQYLGLLGGQGIPGVSGGAAGAGATAPLVGGAGGVSSTLPAAVNTPAGLSAEALSGIGGGGASPLAAGGGLLPAAGLGLLGGGVGAGVSSLLGANEDISQGLTLGGAGAGIGFAVGGPIGAAIGGFVGVGASLLDDIGDFFGGLF